MDPLRDGMITRYQENWQRYLSTCRSEVRNNLNIRVYAGKDTYAAGRIIQKWRKPTNPVSQGKLLTKDLAPNTFHIGIDDVNKSVNEVVKLIRDNKNFAVLTPISVTSEIARQENKEGVRCHDHELEMKVHAMSKITLASSAEVWLINHSGEPFNHFYNNDMEGLGLSACQEAFKTSYEEMKMYCNNVEEQDMEAFSITRSQRKLHESSSEILTPASETIISGNRHTQEQGVSTIVPINDNGTIR